MKIRINYTTRAIDVVEESKVFQYSHNVDEVIATIDFYDASKVYKFNFVDGSGTANLSRNATYLGTVDGLSYFKVRLNRQNTAYGNANLKISFSIFTIDSSGESPVYTRVFTSEQWEQFIEESNEDASVDIDPEEATIVDEIYAAIGLKLNATLKGYYTSNELGLTGSMTTQEYVNAVFTALTDVSGDFLFDGYANIVNNIVTITDVPAGVSETVLQLSTKTSDNQLEATAIIYGRDQVSTHLYYGTHDNVTFNGWNKILTLAELNDVLDGTTSFSTMTIDDGTGNLAEFTFDGTNPQVKYNGDTEDMFETLKIEIVAQGTVSALQVMQYAGSIGVSGKINAKPAVQAEIKVLPSLILGLAYKNLSNNEESHIKAFGKINNVNTSAWVTGTILYYDSEGTTPGALTAVEPTAPNPKIIMGLVTIQSATNGQVKTRPPQLGIGTLQGLNDVYMPIIADGDIPRWVNANSRFEAYNIDSALALKQSLSEKGQANGYVPLNSLAIIDPIYVPGAYDDYVEVATYADLPNPGTEDILYVVIADETSGGNTSTYRWTGSVYVKISDLLSASEVKALYESNPDTNAYTDAEKTKLAGLLSGDNYYTKIEVDRLLSALQAIYGWDTADLGTYVDGETIANVDDYDIVLFQIYDTLVGARTYSSLTVVEPDSLPTGFGANNTFIWQTGGIANGSITKTGLSGTWTFNVTSESTEATCIVTGIKVRNDTMQVQVAENSKDIEGIKNTLAEVNPQQTTEVTKEIEDFVDSLPINVAKGFAKINAEGLTREQLIENGDISTTYTVTGTNRIGIRPDGTWGTNGSYSTSFQIFPNNTTYYFKAKALDSSVGQFDGRLILIYSNGTTEVIGGVNLGLEVEYVFTPSTDLSFNITIFTDTILGDIDRDYQMLIPITNTSWASLTASEIASKISEYWEGEKSLENLTIQTVGKNLFDKSQYTDTDYAYKITIKSSTDYVWSESIAYKTYDINGNELSSGTALTVTSDSNAHYIAFANTIADTDAFQLEEGTSATTYEEHINAEMILKGTFREINASVYDKIVLDNNEYKKEPNVEETTVSGIVAVNTTNYPLAKDGGAFKNYLDSGGSETGVIGTDSTTGAGTLHYQLDDNSLIDIQVIGKPLLARPNQTIIQYDVLEDAGVYDDSTFGKGIIIQHQNSPISELTYLATVDLNSGIETEVTLDNVVVAGDGLSFTSTDLAGNQIVFFKYKVSNPNLATNIDFIYYDSRYVLIDTDDGTPYKLTFTITGGVVNFNLEDLS